MTTPGKIARQIARELRNNPTPAEKLLWDKIRNKQLLGLKILRQHPIFYKYDGKPNFFIPDFYCHELRLAIELDGEIHRKQKGYDQTRTEILGFKDILVLRFTNDEVISNVDRVLSEMKKVIEKRRRQK